MELEESKSYQTVLRNKVLSKCQKQMVIAAKCKMSQVWFNIWIKDHRELSPGEVINVELFLDEENQ
jgi:hypothetical protein